MLPLRLELKNFLPYRTPDPIRFEGIHLACLTGPNGAGKSSLLDAITWGLWGKARARDDELIHIGQQEMMIQLDFEQEGVLYRVVRRRRRGKQGTGSLDLFVLQEDAAPVLINEGSMRQTQDKIDTILRLDYQTFIHSAFLQQGRADAFTMKTPAERKRILSDILGLERWMVYEDRAKDKLRQITTELEALEMRLKEIEEELAREPHYIATMESARKAFDEAKAAQESAQKLLDEVAHAPVELKRARGQLLNHHEHIKQHENSLNAAQLAIEESEAHLAGYREIVALRDAIESGYMTLQQARAAEAELSIKLSEVHSVEKQINELREQISSARSDLVQQQSGIQARIDELGRALILPDDHQWSEVQAQIGLLTEIELARDSLNAQAQQDAQDRAGLRATLENLRAEGTNLGERLEKLEATSEPVCPLCGQPLDETHRVELIAQLTEERDTLREQYRDHQQRIKVLDETLTDSHRQLEKMNGELVQLAPLRERAGALQTRMDQAAEAQARLEIEQGRLQAISDKLEGEDFAHDLREKLNDLVQLQVSLDYDESVHKDTRTTLQEYLEYEKQHRRLQLAEEMLPKEEERLQKAQMNQQAHQQALEKEQAAVEALLIEIAQLEVLEKEAVSRREEVNRQSTLANSAYENLVSSQQQLKALEIQRKRRIEVMERQEALRHEEAVYKDLRQAFSKNGVPAMIIETAIPELESEANDLLARMTDGRMNLRLMTQREKITGGTAETLDIEIADELGTRGYELYSGGEAFRINFAVRIALSKMLARRAGAHLRTLFIDEGFGTQDDDGRNKLVEAITAIQDDFDLILVITHIDELRDSFPVHVLIDKTSSGSTLSVR